MVNYDLSQFFTPDAIIRSLETLPPLNSPFMDTFYPEATRRSHPLPHIAVKDLLAPVSNIKISKRGGNPIPVGGDSMSITQIVPQPFRPMETILAAEVNDYKAISNDSLQSLIDRKIDTLRRIIRKSTEVLCIQSLSGAISYPMSTDEGSATYTVDYGSTLSYTPAVLWNASTIALDNILKQLTEMKATINDASQFGQTTVIKASPTPFYALAKLINNLGNDNRIDAKVQGTFITLGEFRIDLENSSYYDLSTGTSKKSLTDGKIVMVATDAPFELVYAAIDDFDSDMSGMPFFVKQIPDPRRSSIDIIAQSKPLPVPYTTGICWATVV